MKHALEFGKNNAVTNNNWMRVLLILGIVLSTVIFTLTSCSKEEENAEYYVKYEVSSTTIYMGGKLNVSINTEEDEPMNLEIKQRSNWEAIVGPVKKGFLARLSVAAKGETYDKLKLYTKISVSKNGRPFALKVNNGSDLPRDYVFERYTIDY